MFLQMTVTLKYLYDKLSHKIKVCESKFSALIRIYFIKFLLTELILYLIDPTVHEKQLQCSKIIRISYVFSTFSISKQILFSTFQKEVLQNSRIRKNYVGIRIMIV